MAKISKSEVHAYVHILHELTTKKGWDKKDIFTQQECLKIKPIAEQLGQKKLEIVVKISEDIYYVIEAKNERNKLNQALKEAKNDYADLINQGKKVQALFITGIAGNSDEGFIAKSQYYTKGNWETITENGIEITGLLSKNQVEIILSQKSSALKEIEVSDQEFLQAAEEINGILHEGGINKDYRARVMSALLLAISEGTGLNLDEKPTILISSINSRVDLVLRRHNKPNFSRFIKIELPSSEDNHNKFKKALVLTIQELLGLNIRSAMNSGKDILGKFYEVFLKYGNGAKEIGIVLTPRHITKFAAEVLDVQSNDLVLDPTFGTGGFLVSAFDEVKKKTKKDDFKKFKLYGLYGIEQQDPVVALAIVNMIFRGDGKNNIIEGDCFAKWLSTSSTNGTAIAEYLSKDKEGRIPPITKVLMNPPFPKKKTDYKEYLFIEQALKQMQNDGILFSVVPYSCMVRGGGYKNWRKRLLTKNTLLSVVTFPEDLFYPVGVLTAGIFIKKGVPHKKDSNVLWIRALHDGLKKKKGKRLENPKEPNDYIKINDLLKSFIKDQTINVKNIDEFQKSSPIDFSDKQLELVPEVYLDQKPPTEKEIEDEIEKLIREDIAFIIRSGKEDDFLNASN
jgi:type I restriction-modification system DNA methylase subunit